MKKENNKSARQISLLHLFRFSFILLASITFVVLLITIAFSIIYAKTSNSGIFIAMVVVDGAFILLSIAALIIFANAIYRFFFSTFYQISKNNIELMVEQHRRLERYPAHRIEEFEEINSSIEKLEKHYQGVTVVSKNNDYSNLDLEYLSEDKKEVTFTCLIKNYRKIILCSQTFRNALINFAYDTNNEKMDDNDVRYIIDSIKKGLNYDGLLISKDEKSSNFLVYLPQIDNITTLKEEITTLLKDTAILARSPDGIDLSNAKTSVVIYPYSNIEDMLSDLRYAMRQNKPLNFYLPNRFEALYNNNLLQTSMNMNNVCKILESLSTLQEDIRKGEKVRNQLSKIMKYLTGYLSFDYSGIIEYDNIDDEYFSSVTANIKEDELFPVGSIFNHEFVHILEQSKDPDYSYYFSDRDHASKTFGRYLDVYGISSGHFYLMYAEKECIGLIYFLNKGKNASLDSYMRESVMVASFKISETLKEVKNALDLATVTNQSRDILKLSNFLTYTIDKKTYTLTSISDSLRDTIPSVIIGDKCYRSLYGKDAPCARCPLLTGSKMNEKIKTAIFETSLTLNSQKSKLSTLLMKENKDEYYHERFDPDLLINTYYSLYENLKNAYFIQGKGYFVFLHIDNSQDLVFKHGPEGLSFILRAFCNALKSSDSRLQNIFLYRDNILAIMLPEIGRIDVIDICEKIYTLSKREYIEEQNEDYLKISYTSINYPQAYANPEDFLRHVDRSMSGGNKAIDSDMIFFEENKYKRSANREEFMLSVIENSFNLNTFNVKLQPMVNPLNKRIIGAEILIRIFDEYRNTYLNTTELIDIAGKYNKIGDISVSLVDYIGDLYNKYGFTIFKTHGFNRLSLNTDYSYFSDPHFIETISTLMNKYFLPKNFLSFEITEKDVFNHYDALKNITPLVVKNDILLSCDQYTGEYVSMEKLKVLGFSEVKIPRFIVKDIEKDDAKFKEVLALVDAANRLGLNTTLVGVENVDQLNLIKEEGKSCYMQGFYFYQPLDPNELIDAVRKVNI